MKELFSLIILFGTAIGMRIYHLGALPADIDELLQLFVASRPTLNEMLSAVYSLGPQQYPFDYFLSYFALKLTTSLHILRLLPCFWSLMSIVLIYSLGRSLLDHHFGWIWAWLLTVSTLHIEYAQTFRPYSLITFLSCAGLLAFHYLLRTRRGVMVYVAASIAHQLTYPFAILKNSIDVLAARHRGGMKNATLALMAVPILIPLLHWFFMGNSLVSAPSFGYPASDAVGVNALKYFWISFNQSTKYVLAIYTLFFLYGVVRGYRDRQLRSFVAYGLVLMILTVMAVVASVYFSHLFLRPRHAIVVLPLYLGVVALGVYHLVSKKTILFFSVFSLLTLAGAWVPLKRTAHGRMIEKGRLISHMNYISEHAGPEDVLVFSNPGYAATFAYYFDRASFFKISKIVLSNSMDLFLFPNDFRMQGNHSFPAYVIAKGNSELSTIVKGEFKLLKEKIALRGGSVWLIHSSFNHLQESNPLFAELGIAETNVNEIQSGLIKL